MFQCLTFSFYIYSSVGLMDNLYNNITNVQGLTSTTKITKKKNPVISFFMKHCTLDEPSLWLRLKCSFLGDHCGLIQKSDMTEKKM